jgi:hypothetical protein
VEEIMDETAWSINGNLIKVGYKVRAMDESRNHFIHSGEVTMIYDNWIYVRDENGKLGAFRPNHVEVEEFRS